MSTLANAKMKSLKDKLEELEVVKAEVEKVEEEVKEEMKKETKVKKSSKKK